jgi:hypothetical protein
LLSNNEAWELSTLAHKLKNIIDHVKEKLLLCSVEIRKPLSSFIPCYFLFFFGLLNYESSDRGILALSDDSVMMNQVQATHFPNGREVDAKPLLCLVEDIFNRATLNPNFLFGTTV